MHGSRVEKPSDESVEDESGGHGVVVAPAASDALPHESPEPSNEHQEILASVHRLEAELERYRVHADRTGKLFLSATSYAEWVREQARHDAELALRKARARAEKLDRATGELEWTESELARVQDELARLRALTDETRAQLSAFLAAGLQALNNELPDKAGDGHPALGDLQDTLQERLASASQASPTPLPEVDRPQV